MLQNRSQIHYGKRQVWRLSGWCRRDNKVSLVECYVTAPYTPCFTTAPVNLWFPMRWRLIQLKRYNFKKTTYSNVYITHEYKFENLRSEYEYKHEYWKFVLVSLPLSRVTSINRNFEEQSFCPVAAHCSAVSVIRDRLCVIILYCIFLCVLLYNIYYK